ncbi:MAG: hypothetical protein MUC94_12360 [bacterium]|jgi:hypothetical protein|nr:hypothetical protein [bacterium]
MRNKLATLIALFLALGLLFGSIYAQEPEKPPAKRKTFEEAERQYLEQIRQLEATLRLEREQQHKELQHQEQTLQLIYEKDITPEQEQEILERIKKENPEQAKELMFFKKEQPLRFKQFLIQRQHEFERLEELKERDPERFEQKKKEQFLEQQSRQLAEKFRASKDEKEKAKIKSDLSIVLSELFDLREKDREEEMKLLNEKLETLKSVLNERKQKKKEIIDRRLQELIGDKDLLLW